MNRLPSHQFFSHLPITTWQWALSMVFIWWGNFITSGRNPGRRVHSKPAAVPDLFLQLWAESSFMKISLQLETKYDKQTRRPLWAEHQSISECIYREELWVCAEPSFHKMNCFYGKTLTALSPLFSTRDKPIIWWVQMFWNGDRLQWGHQAGGVVKPVNKCENSRQTWAMQNSTERLQQIIIYLVDESVDLISLLIFY